MDLLRTLWTHKEYDYEYAPYLYEWLGYIHILLFRISSQSCIPIS